MAVLSAARMALETEGGAIDFTGPVVMAVPGGPDTAATATDGTPGDGSRVKSVFVATEATVCVGNAAVGCGFDTAVVRTCAGVVSRCAGC